MRRSQASIKELSRPSIKIDTEKDVKGLLAFAISLSYRVPADLCGPCRVGHMACGEGGGGGLEGRANTVTDYYFLNGKAKAERRSSSVEKKVFAWCNDEYPWV